jgi:hypothetical protein
MIAGFFVPANDRLVVELHKLYKMVILYRLAHRQ